MNPSRGEYPRLKELDPLDPERPLERFPIQAPGKRRSLRRYALLLGRHALLIVMIFAFVLPFFWMIVSALKPNNMVFSQPI